MGDWIKNFLNLLCERKKNVQETNIEEEFDSFVASLCAIWIHWNEKGLSISMKITNADKKEQDCSTQILRILRYKTHMQRTTTFLGLVVL